MTSILHEPLTDVEYSKIKSKGTHKAAKVLEQVKGRMSEKSNHVIKNVPEPAKKHLIL